MSRGYRMYYGFIGNLIGVNIVGSRVDIMRVIEGYLYLYPYAGDDIFIHPEKIDLKSFRDLSRIHQDVWRGRSVSLLEFLSKFEGRRVRVLIEERKLILEVLD